MSECIEFRGAGAEEAMRRLLLNANRPEALGLTRDVLESVPLEVEGRLGTLLRDPFRVAKRRTRPVWQKILRTAACAVLALSVAVSGLLALNPEARAFAAQIWSVIVTWGDRAAEFYGAGEQVKGITGTWVLSEVPEGFESISTFEVGELRLTRYKNGAGDRLSFEYQPVQEGYMFDFDNEHSNYSEPTINGRAAYLFDSNAEGKMSALIWYNENGTVGFQLMGDFTGAELLELATKVVREE